MGICARHSTKLTRLIGDKAVSILVTLFLLSYAKLLQTIIVSIGFTPLKVFTNDHDSLKLAHAGPIVWSLDGNYTYGHFPHILLLIAALLTF